MNNTIKFLTNFNYFRTKSLKKFKYIMQLEFCLETFIWCFRALNTETL